MTYAFAKPGLNLITGGAWAGKSLWTTIALEALKQEATWIVTGSVDDPVALETSLWLNQRKSAGSRILQAPLNLTEMIQSQSSQKETLVIDSLNLWLGNTASAAAARYSDDQLGAILQSGVEELLEALMLQVKYRCVIAVTADLGWSVPPQHRPAYELRKRLGLLNQRLATMSEYVYTVQCGIGQILKRPQNSPL